MIMLVVFSLWKSEPPGSIAEIHTDRQPGVRERDQVPKHRHPIHVRERLRRLPVGQGGTPLLQQFIDLGATRGHPQSRFSKSEPDSFGRCHSVLPVLSIIESQLASVQGRSPRRRTPPRDRDGVAAWPLSGYEPPSH